jgi:hypothetical protein
MQDITLTSESGDLKPAVVEVSGTRGVTASVERTAAIAGDSTLRYRVRVAVAGSAPAGAISTRIRIVTGLAEPSELIVVVRGKVE